MPPGGGGYFLLFLLLLLGALVVNDLHMLLGDELDAVFLRPVHAALEHERNERREEYSLRDYR